MTKKAQRKLRMRMKRTFREAQQAKRKHARMISNFKKLQRKYRAA